VTILGSSDAVVMVGSWLALIVDSRSDNFSNIEIMY